MSSIKEIAGMINNSDLIRADFYDAYASANDLIRDRYFSKFHSVIRKHNDNVTKNPSKEVQLLKTMKLFSHPEKHKDIDNLVNALTKYDTLRSIEQEFNEANGDGSFRSNNQMMLFMLSAMMNK